MAPISGLALTVLPGCMPSQPVEDTMGGMMVGGAMMVRSRSIGENADVVSSNGVTHVIDSVLVPN